MKLRKAICYVLFCAFTLGCSKEDDGLPGETTSFIPDFKVVGEDIDNIYQFNYKANQNDGDIINLTTENNVALQYLELSQVNDLLTFYSFSSGNFSAIQVDAVTREEKVLSNFYTVSDERSILWGANSEDKIFVGYFSPQGSTNYGVRIIEQPGEEPLDINIEFSVSIVFQPLYYNGKLLLTYRDNQNQNKVSIMNTEANTLTGTLEFGGAKPSLFINEQGDIGVVLAMDDERQEYRVYDFETLELKHEQSFSLDRLFDTGPLSATESDDRLFYSYAYSQPSSVISAPAIYDFALNENSVIDMIGISQQVAIEQSANIILSAIDYKVEAKVFLVGYGKQDGNILEGGVLVISEKGELIENITLPFAPTYIVQ